MVPSWQILWHHGINRNTPLSKIEIFYIFKMYYENMKNLPLNEPKIIKIGQVDQKLYLKKGKFFQKKIF